MRALIGGVGYRDLRDHSLGPMISDALGLDQLPEGVEVDDLSYNPVAVGQWLAGLANSERPERIVLVAAIERGRAPGAVVAYRWDGVLPDAERVQLAVADAVTGVINLDNSLLVLGQFGPMPRELVVIEVEPAVEAFGEALSPRVEARFEEVRRLALELATAGALSAHVTLAPIGGPVVTAGPP